MENKNSSRTIISRCTTLSRPAFNDDSTKSLMIFATLLCPLRFLFTPKYNLGCSVRKYALLLASAGLLALAINPSAGATTVRLQTPLGAIDVVLFDTAAPLTVANFLSYMNSGAYNNSFIHRSIPGFIIQSGGYTWDSALNTVAIIPKNAPVKNEFSAIRSNLRGTIAMAKLGGDPNSATSEWFINLGNNALNLDNQNGGFTVFGQVSTSSMAVVDALASLPIVNAGGAFTDLPLLSLPSSGGIQKSNLALVNAVSRLPLAAIDIDGNGKHEILIRADTPTAAPGQLQIGRLFNNLFQFSAQADPGPEFRLIGVGDFDGNGKADLVFQNTTQGDKGDVVFWYDFLPAKQRIVRQLRTVWDVQAVGDLDGDGLADLAWRYLAPDPRDTGVSYIWFTNSTEVPYVRKRGGAPLDWKLLGAADLNSDGAADMIYLSPDGAIRALMATADRSCANFSAGIIPTGYSALKLADFTGRGRGDILFRNLSTGEMKLISMNANGLALPPSLSSPNDPNASCTASDLMVATTTFPLPTIDPSWTFYASGDFNGDGIYDIAWLRPNRTLTLWLMNANGAAPTVVDNAGTAPAGFTPVQP